MRIVCISDTHGCQPHLPLGDVLIHAGDLSSHGTAVELWRAGDWLRSQMHQYKLVIAGNHDFLLERDISCLHGLTYLQDSGTVIGGHLFWGSPWVPRFQRWAFMKERGEEIRESWQRIPEETGVLITHGPPRGIMDQVQRALHVGCLDLLERVRTVKPLLHVFGHIHECGGVYVEDQTTFVGAAHVAITPDHKPLTGRPPVVLEIR